jgi:hypothetical protein
MTPPGMPPLPSMASSSSSSGAFFEKKTPQQTPTYSNQQTPLSVADSELVSVCDSTMSRKSIEERSPVKSKSAVAKMVVNYWRLEEKMDAMDDKKDRNKEAKDITQLHPNATKTESPEKAQQGAEKKPVRVGTP